MFEDLEVSDRGILAGATLVAIVATVGSLWLSEVWRLVPCDLCWYQRILMYPLVVVLGVAAWEGRPAIARTVLPLSGFGTVIAAYHSWIQTTAGAGGAGCTIGSCGQVLFRLQPLGLTIPNLSLVAFLFVTATMAWLLWR